MAELLSRVAVDAIDLAYGAAAGDRPWLRFLEAVGDLAGGDNVYLSRVRLSRQSLECEVLDAARWHPSDLVH